MNSGFAPFATSIEHQGCYIWFTPFIARWRSVSLLVLRRYLSLFSEVAPVSCRINAASLLVSTHHIVHRKVACMQFSHPVLRSGSRVVHITSVVHHKLIRSNCGWGVKIQRNGSFSNFVVRSWLTKHLLPPVVCTTGGALLLLCSWA